MRRILILQVGPSFRQVNTPSADSARWQRERDRVLSPLPQEPPHPPTHPSRLLHPPSLTLFIPACSTGPFHRPSRSSSSTNQRGGSERRDGGTEGQRDRGQGRISAPIWPRHPFLRKAPALIPLHKFSSLCFRFQLASPLLPFGLPDNEEKEEEGEEEKKRLFLSPIMSYIGSYLIRDY